MNYMLKMAVVGALFGFNAVWLNAAPTIAQTLPPQPPSSPRPDRIPALLQYPSSAQAVRVRCVEADQRLVNPAAIANFHQSNTQQTMAPSSLRIFPSSTPVTLALPETCREVWIQLQETTGLTPELLNPGGDRPAFDLDSLLDYPASESWLTREGSGWQWLILHTH